MQVAPTHRRSLWPREHGAYVQLAAPLITAEVVREPSLAMLALGAGAVLGFLAHEPLLVALGNRGPRLLASDGARARTRLALLTCAAVALGAAGLGLAPHAALAAGIAVVPAALVLLLAWRRAEHTPLGEVTAAIALTGAALPVAVAGGAPLDVALVRWLAWALGFAATVAAVHRVIARHKRNGGVLDLALGLGLAGLTGVALHWPALHLAIPLAAVAVVLVAVPPRASRLRAVGVAITLAAIGAGAVVVIGAH